MLSYFQIFLVFLSALTIIVADAIIKKVSAAHTFAAAFQNPWMLVAYALYFIQILLAIYIFIYKGEIALYSNLYVIFYGVFGVIAGIILFQESISMIQLVGVVLGLIGAVLMNH